MNSWREECGVFGIWNHEDSSRLTYLGLFAMQHRGQESAGIVSLDQGKHFSFRGLGLVGDVFSDERMQKLPGFSSIGHVRYSTTGDNLLENAQPLTAELLHGPIAIAHNGNVVNHRALRERLQKSGAIFQGSSDTESLLHLLARNSSADIQKALSESLVELVGAYSFVVLTHNQLIAIRDPYGFRPLVLGKKSNAYIVASESCALDLIGADFVREIDPGEMLCISDGGLKSYSFQKVEKKAHCIFEHVYFARPDSIVFGKSVYESRKKLGEWLAKESAVEADVVVPVPDSGVPAAIGYSKQSQLPFEFGIIRNHYVGRTFIQPHQSVRNFGVKVKLNPQSAVLKGKRVILVDDSLVRGTTSQKIVRLVRQAGAKEVHMRIASPPTVGPCYYGVDTPQKSQLIAANQSVEEIRRFIEADTLAYLSIEGLRQAVGDQQNHCAACFDGQYPTRLD